MKVRKVFLPTACVFNRREALKSMALGAITFATSSMPALASAQEEPGSKTIPQTKELEDDSTFIKTLRFIDPNLSSMIINLTYYFTEAIIFHKANYKKLIEGTGNITEAELIHNNSDRWANAMATTISSIVSYSGRLPFTLWVANDSSKNTIEAKRQNKLFSDFMTINTYYGQTTVDRYLTNPFQHELREAYKKILKEKPEYKYQPWAIPISEVINIFHNILPTVYGGALQDLKRSTTNFKKLADEKARTEWLTSRRNQLDLLLIFLSYISTFVNFIPLATANTVNISTTNTATGRTFANIPSVGILSRDLLRRLQEKQDKEGFSEAKVMATAYLCNGPPYYIINSSIQSFIDSAFGLKKYSDNDVGYSNLREIIGGVIGCFIYMGIQYKLESAIRSNIKSNATGLERENLLTRFGSWYVEPKKQP